MFVMLLSVVLLLRLLLVFLLLLFLFLLFLLSLFVARSLFVVDAGAIVSCNSRTGGGGSNNVVVCKGVLFSRMIFVDWNIGRLFTLYLDIISSTSLFVSEDVELLLMCCW